MTDVHYDQLGEQLSAYLDGELEAAQVREVEQLLLTDARAQAMFEALQETSGLVANLPRRAAPSTLVDEITSQLERQELLAAPEQHVVEPTTRPKRILARLLATAAMLCLVAYGTWTIVDLGEAKVGSSTSSTLALNDAKDTTGDAPAPAADAIARTKKKHLVRRDGTNRRIGADSADSAISGAAEAPPSVGSAATKTFTDQMPLETKLANGADLRVVEDHLFEVEPIQMRVVVRNEAEREAILNEVEQQFASRGAVDAHTSASAARRGPAAGSSAATGRVMLRGVMGRNTLPTGDEEDAQVLLRVETDELYAMVSNFGHGTAVPTDVSLQAGPVQVRGLSQTQTMIRLMDDSLQSESMESEESLRDGSGDDENSRDATADGASGITPFADFLRNSGVDPEDFRQSFADRKQNEKGEAKQPRSADAASEAVGPSGESATAKPNAGAGAAPSEDQPTEGASEGDIQGDAPADAAKDAGTADEGNAREKGEGSLVERRLQELERHRGAGVDSEAEPTKPVTDPAKSPADASPKPPALPPIRVATGEDDRAVEEESRWTAPGRRARLVTFVLQVIVQPPPMEKPSAAPSVKPPKPVKPEVDPAPKPPAVEPTTPDPKKVKPKPDNKQDNDVSTQPKKEPRSTIRKDLSKRVSDRPRV
jgi:hypothetical protein